MENNQLNENGIQEKTNEIQEQPNEKEEIVEEPKTEKETLKEKKSNGCKVLLIIFIIISLSLAGWIIYDKLIKKEEECPVVEPEKKEETNTNDNQLDQNVPNETNCEVKEEEKKEIKIEVVDAYTDIQDYGDFKGKGIRIPKMTGNTETIQNLNEKIMKDSLNKIRKYEDLTLSNIEESIELTTAFLSEEYTDDEYKESLESANSYYGCYKILDFSYKNIEKDDIMIIETINDFNQTFNGQACWNASWSESNIGNYYFYDKQNDKELTLEEAATKLNAKLNNKGICKKASDLKDASNMESVVISFDKNKNMNIFCEDYSEDDE